MPRGGPRCDWDEWGDGGVRGEKINVRSRIRRDYLQESLQDRLLALLNLVRVLSTNEFRQCDHGVCADECFFVVEAINKSVTKLIVCILAEKASRPQSAKIHGKERG